MQTGSFRAVDFLGSHNLVCPSLPKNLKSNRQLQTKGMIVTKVGVHGQPRFDHS